MSAKHRCNRHGSQKGPFNPLTPANLGRSRAALLASASLVALAAFGSPAAQAACSGKDRTISSHSFPGPVFGTGGDITVDVWASVAGGPTGVYARNCGIGALSNGGAIGGATVGHAPGGIGVRANSGQIIDLLTNATGATISGGAGGSSSGLGLAGGAGDCSRC